MMVAGHRWVAGIDEVGRGPLAGPVTAAAVILDPDRLPAGIDDSKALAEDMRTELLPLILARAVAVGVGFASVAEIERVNIRQATFLAMRRATAALAVRPTAVLVDGKDPPPIETCAVSCLVKGDALCLSVAAASIVAKVLRDRMMLRLHACHPAYGFDAHKGYATARHRAALRRHGPSPHHRLSFLTRLLEDDVPLPDAAVP